MSKNAQRTNSWAHTVESTTAWAGSNPGTLVTPGASNVYGSYTSIIAGSAWATAGAKGDGCLLEFWALGSGVSSSAKDTILTVALDLAGGTSFTTILVTDLICGPAADFSSGQCGVPYVFPVRIPNGASLGVKASVNNATAGTVGIAAKIRCDPTEPDMIRVGEYVRTFGASAATSAGTAVTPGSVTKGSWVQLGSAIAASDRLWWWQVGVGFNQATANNNGSCVDLGIGDASNKFVALRDIPVHQTASESIGRDRHDGGFAAQPGDLVYGRKAEAAGVLTGWSMAAYAVGG